MFISHPILNAIMPFHLIDRHGSNMYTILNFRLKLECEKLAQEKTEMQRHYVMVSFLINLFRSRSQIKRG